MVNIDAEDLKKLAFREKVRIEDLSEKAKADIKETGLLGYSACRGVHKS